MVSGTKYNCNEIVTNFSSYFDNFLKNLQKGNYNDKNYLSRPSGFNRIC